MTPATYTWPGGTEAILRFGAGDGPLVIAVPPPFEEANRTRAFLVAILRALAAHGIAGALPDLPGMGDSLTETEYASLSNWKIAFSFLADASGKDRAVHALSIRGSALLDTQAVLAGRYHVAPATGASLVRDMIRSRLAAAKEAGETFDLQAIAPPGPPVELAGNRISRQMLADLRTAVPGTAGPIRTVRLDTDPLPADRKITAAPLWRRAEPDNDPALAALIADDLAAWIGTCAA